jgi:hypothetical protein
MKWHKCFALSAGIFMLRPWLKLKCLSSFRCLLVLTLRSTFDCTEVSADRIRKQEPSAESWVVLSEAGEDYKGSKTEVLETMKAAKFDVFNNKVIFSNPKHWNLIVLPNNVQNPFDPHSIPTTSILRELRRLQEIRANFGLRLHSCT